MGLVAWLCGILLLTQLARPSSIAISDYDQYRTSLQLTMSEQDQTPRSEDQRADTGPISAAHEGQQLAITGQFEQHSDQEEHGSSFTKPLSDAYFLMERLDAMGHEKWGWVIYRTDYNDDEAWVKFKDIIETESRDHLMSCGDAPGLDERLEWVFIEDRMTLDGATIEQLRALFKPWADEAAKGELPSADDFTKDIGRNARYDYFIRADGEAIQSVIEDKLHRGKPDSDVVGHVDFASAIYFAEPLEDLLEDLDITELDEPVEGCYSDDVGWMRIPFRMLNAAWYNTIQPDVWDVYYHRPYELADSFW